MAVLMTPPYLQFFDSNGDVLAGGKVYTFTATGTFSTAKATYTTAAGDVQHPNPVELDSAGRPTTGNGSIWLSGTYDIVVKDANDATVKTTLGVTAFTALPSANESYFETLSGNGTTTAFTLSEDVGTDEKAVYVWVNNAKRDYVTNGTFATDTGWTKGSGWTIGAGVATAAGAISTAIEQSAAFTVSQYIAYTVTYTITRSAGGLIPSIGGVSGVERTASGTYTETIIAGSTQVIAFTGNGFTGTLDSVSILVENSAGLQIQSPSNYTVSGTSLTFTSAPANDTANIYVSAPSLLVGAASSAAASAASDAASALASKIAAQTAETNAETAETNAAASAATAALADDWAVKTNGLVDSTDYSAKAWAIGGTGTTTNNAKYYSEQAAGAVTGSILPMTEQVPTPATPASGVSKLYFKTDSNAYVLDDAGTEKVLLKNSAYVANRRGTVFVQNANDDGLEALSQGTSGQFLTSAGADSLPAWVDAPNKYIGFIFDFGGTALKDDFLACDGAAVSRTTYALLFAEIGTNWGVGDGSTTFNLPLSARRTKVGSGGSGTGTLGNAVGNTGGSETHTLSAGEVPDLNIDASYWDSGSAASGASYTDANRVAGGISVASALTPRVEYTITGAINGGGGSHNNMQPSMVVYMQIKYR